MDQQTTKILEPTGTSSRKFPIGFKWGIASSAYQVEGGHNTDGRTPSIWDEFCHAAVEPPHIDDRSSGDTACDSYHKYREDIRLLKEIGAQMYRFSISWSRILPDGTKAKVNLLGIDYYNRLIDELLVNGIEPMVTLFHWDTPAAFKDGWVNEEIVDHFAEYARICFENFGDRVKYWITINEPHVYAVLGYTNGIFAPGLKEKMTSTYVVAHNMLKAHALSYRIYEKDFKISQNGKIGITLDSDGFLPLGTSEEDVKATERAFQFRLGWFAHPVIKGDYPSVMREYIDKKSKAEGRSSSRLPKLSSEWIAKLKGSLDFLGVNNYTARLVKYSLSPSGGVSFHNDSDTEDFVDPSWKANGCHWLYVVPEGIRILLNWIAKEYDNIEVIITENGFGGPDGTLDDKERVEYFRTYVTKVRESISDGCNITGYIAWTLMDNFEWKDGFGIKFGVHSVDFESPERIRTPRSSAKFLGQLFSQNEIPTNQ